MDSEGSDFEIGQTGDNGTPIGPTVSALEHARELSGVECCRSLRVKAQNCNVPDGEASNAGLNGPRDGGGVPTRGAVGALEHPGPIGAYVKGRRRSWVNDKIGHNDGG